MKKRKLRRDIGKRGASTITIVRAFGIAMAAFIIVVLIQYWRDIKNDTFLEKNYMARDIALLITTAYASPGDLTYCYYDVGNYKGKFDYLIENSKVTIVDKGQPFIEGGAVYYYADSKSGPVPRVEISGKDAEELAVLQIVKGSSGVKVLKKMVGEDAKPCEP